MNSIKSCMGGRKKIGTGIMGILLLCTSLMAAPQKTYPVDWFGQLSVKNKKIVDKNGRAVQLRGMSLFWSQHGHRYWNENVVKWLRDDWKVHVIRAPMGVKDEEGEGYIKEPTRHETYVRRVVDACIKHGVYVIIDWHDHAAHKYRTQARAFFNKMATDYGDKPNVIYEIYNEPMNVDWNTIKTYSNSVISSIRSKDRDNLIVVGTPNWCQNLDHVLNNQVSGTNIVYSFHFYAASHSGLKWQLQNAIGKIPVFVTEWGTCEYNGGGRFDRNESNNWLQTMKTNNISWCNWSIMGKNETSAALKVGVSSQGGWTSSDLSESGKFVRSYLRANSPIKQKSHQQNSNRIHLFSTKTDIHLHTGNMHVTGTITLHNILGRTVATLQCVDKGNYILPRTSLCSGIYFVRLNRQSMKIVLK